MKTIISYLLNSNILYISSFDLMQNIKSRYTLRNQLKGTRGKKTSVKHYFFKAVDVEK